MGKSLYGMRDQHTEDARRSQGKPKGGTKRHKLHVFSFKITMLWVNKKQYIDEVEQEGREYLKVREKMKNG
jgi:hypothetical protein